MTGLKWSVLVLPLFLGGCLVPLPVTIASLSLSGAAYLDSGKTMPEHALSAATARDCSFFRAMSGSGPVCQAEEAPGTILLAGGPETTTTDPYGCQAAMSAHEASLTGCRSWTP